MSGKRLAKRSIVGTRVSALRKEDNLFHTGIIVGTKSGADEIHPFFAQIPKNSSISTRYLVRFEEVGGGSEVGEFIENELVGPGFGPTSNLKLRSGQRVFVTVNGREVSGTVVFHQVAKDEVLINIQPQNGSSEIPFDVTKRLDEVRLMESRKSARLQEQEMDFALLADMSPVGSKRNTTTASIDVPKTTTMSRKRRPSSSSGSLSYMSGESGGMEECAAAMVLMSLSCSPRSPNWEQSGMVLGSSWGSSSTSSGASSWLSSHYPTSSPTPSSSDDGLGGSEGEEEEERPRKKRNRILFTCTWPGCGIIKESCFEIETHVRFNHLGPKTSESGEHEEEFYYTEREVSEKTNYSPSYVGSGYILPFSPTLSHMDMVRPPSEDPEYKMSQNVSRKSPSSVLNHSKKRLSPKSSPIRRPRGDSKKCRKVYGMERKEMWCTQCKWKKACSRFSDLSKTNTITH